MIGLHVLFLIIAAVCFFLAAIAPIFTWNIGRFQAVAWGLFFWVLSNFV